MGWFDRQGVEAVHVRHLGMAAASDSEIWAYALREGLVIITRDEDFASRRGQAEGPQILWPRIGNAQTRILERYLEQVWPLANDYLAAGERIVQV